MRPRCHQEKPARGILQQLRISGLCCRINRESIPRRLAWLDIPNPDVRQSGEMMKFSCWRN